MQPVFDSSQHRTDDASNSFIDLVISVPSSEKQVIFLLTLPASTNSDLTATAESILIANSAPDKVVTKELP